MDPAYHTPMNELPTIVWFRKDLRLRDQPALCEAVERGGPLIPVFLWSPETDSAWGMGAAQRVFLHDALKSLDADLRERGLRLIIRKTDDCLATLRELVEATGAGAVLWNRGYEPTTIARDSEIKSALNKDRLYVRSYNGSLIFEPHEVATGAGDPYKVYTPFWKAVNALEKEIIVLDTPRRDRMIAPKSWPDSLSVDDLDLLPPKREGGWEKRIREHWPAGEQDALNRFRAFLDTRAATYKEQRNYPDRDATSCLSPYLALGQISPRLIWQQAEACMNDQSDADARASVEHFLKEMVWREFSYHLLYYFPHTTTEPLRPKFAEFPWHDDDKALTAWQRGQTGYPIVDAGMRQLWATGWMHNRVRMIVASFLCKDLLIDWQTGSRWFWDTLVDADLANNTQGWQWTAGSGADAQPFFRIFNPITQGEKFDPDGDYVRQWVPELAELPGEYIHKPWELPLLLRQEIGLTLGEDYPERIVDHAEARKVALAALDKMK